METTDAGVSLSYGRRRSVAPAANNSDQEDLHGEQKLEDAEQWTQEVHDEAFDREAVNREEVDRQAQHREALDGKAEHREALDRKAPDREAQLGTSFGLAVRSLAVVA